MKAFRLAIAALVLIMAALLASPASAQSKGSATLSGKIVDDQGQPVADAVVQAVMVGQTDPASTQSDKKGEWKLKNLSEGQWRLEVGKPGLETSKQVVEIRNNKVPAVNITMAKPAPKADPTVEINTAVAQAAQLAQGGKIVEARKIYEDLLVKYPTVYQLEGLIARTYAFENQPAKAMEHVTVALEKAPTDVDLLVLKADLLMETGDKAGAKAILDGIDITQVKDPMPFVNAAIVTINEGKGDEAAAALTKLLAQFPSQNEIYYYRGRAYVIAKKYDEARADLEKFVAVAPTAKEAVDAKKVLDQLPKK
ncbi:MAG: tetratricopeptide repeat protein [Acidobacteriota bacterium]